MDVSTLERHALALLRKPLTLKDALLEVSDFRISRRRKYPLYEILMIAVCAMVAGAKGPFGVASLRSVQAANSQCSAASGKRTGYPLFTGCWSLAAGCRSTSAVGRRKWLESVSDVTGDIISIDGKLLRRALTKDGKMPCIVSAYSKRSKLVIGQVKADEKSNEITAIPGLLDLLYLKGAIVTIDAAGCQKKTVKKILKRGAGYVISLKGNLQASLRSEVSQQPASSNSASSGKRTGALSPLVAGYWLLVVGTLRPQAASKSAWSSQRSTTRRRTIRRSRRGSSSRRCRWIQSARSR